MTLNDFMLSQIFVFFLVFCRVGTAIMVMPGFGEAYISARVRLLFAAMLSLVMTPTMQAFPAVPETLFGLVNLMFAELLTGLFFGMVTRLLISAISLAGMIIAYQSSLASALVQDVTMSGSQGTSLSNLLGIGALVLLFATDLHHVMLQALHDSYGIFSVGAFPIVADFTEHANRVMSEAFLVALQLSAPHIVVGLMIYLAGGIIARLMPSLQVFFILMAPQLLISFFLLMIVFGSLMTYFLDYFSRNVLRFVGQ